MRLALACLTLLPCTALADSFTLRTAPDAVTVYAGQAVVTRSATLDLPAGRHDLVLPGLPLSLQADTIRVSLEGAALGTTEFRARAVPPTTPADTTDIEAAKARITAAEAALATLDDTVNEARLAAEGAAARAAFLQGLGENEGLGDDVATLRALAQMIGDETAAAGRDTLRAEQQVRQINTARPDLQQELKDARAALAALTPPPQMTSQMTLGVTAPEATAVTVTLSYMVGATWAPVYDIYLDDGTVRFKRGALVQQYSDEAWQDVALTLSTFRLSDQIAPREVFPIPLSISDPAAPRPKTLSRSQAGVPQMETMADMASPVIVEETATASFDGPGVSYAAPSPVSVASGVDAVRVALDTLTLSADRFARAAPRLDATAFLMARLTNDTAEPLLASPNASLYRDNTLIGQTWFEQVPAGAKAELAFGPIEDLRLNYSVLNENQGDRGLINRTNMKTEAVRMDIENIGTQDWDVEVLAAVPFTRQEDLDITFEATPAPDSQDVNDKRGVLQWDSTVPAGTVQRIDLTTNVRWPEGKVLR